MPRLFERCSRVKRYKGKRNAQGELIITVDGQPLDRRLDLRNHSPSEFECGYNGSGPAQLALTMLADCLRDDEQAISHYQSFKETVISQLPQDGWSLSSQEISDAVNDKR